MVIFPYDSRFSYRTWSHPLPCGVFPSACNSLTGQLNSDFVQLLIVNIFGESFGNKKQCSAAKH